MTDGIRGTDDLERVARALKAAGDATLRKELLAGIRKAGKPVVDDVKAGGLATIPSRGGLAKKVAGSGIGVRTRLTGRSAGVRIQKSKAVTGMLIDKYGSFRHPVFADGAKTRKEWRWVQQDASLAKGWFTEEIEKRAPEFRKHVEQVLTDTANKIARSV